MTACLAMLADKDAEGAGCRAHAGARAGHLHRDPGPRGRCARRAGPGGRRVTPADDLATNLPRGAGLEAEAEPGLVEAPGASARAGVGGEGDGGILLVTGSHYLLAPARAALSS